MLGKNAKDWENYVLVRAVGIPDLIELVSLGDRFVFSIGAHATHESLLMSRNPSDPLTWEVCQAACALLTYAADCPVVAVPSDLSNMPMKGARSANALLKGTAFASLAEYGARLDELAEATEAFVRVRHQGASLYPRRILMKQSPPVGKWIYLPWAPTEAIGRALSAYWMGMLSILAPSRLLNFWRAIEAVTSRPLRDSLFEKLDKFTPVPVWNECITHSPKGNAIVTHIDATRSLRRLALKRQKQLVSRLGSASAALNEIYWEGRGKAAHADKHSLDYDYSAFLGNQLLDAELLRFTARFAIEEAWSQSNVANSSD